MGEVVLEVRDFSFKYRQTKRKALKKINFQVKKGEFFCIIGANGAGKSTLCNSLVGLIPHYFVGKMSGWFLTGWPNVWLGRWPSIQFVWIPAPASRAMTAMPCA